MTKLKISNVEIEIQGDAEVQVQGDKVTICSVTAPFISRTFIYPTYIEPQPYIYPQITWTSPNS